MSDTGTKTSTLIDTVSALKDISPIFMGSITAILVIWAIVRARSAHFLLDKIWRIVGGGSTHDEDLKKAWLLVRDIEGFRFRTGIKFSTKATLTRTLRWLEHHDKSLNDLSFAKAWIEGKPWDVRRPKMLPIKIFAFVVFLTTTPIIMLMSVAFTETSVLLTIKDSGTTFWTDGVKARNFSLHWPTPDFSLDYATCTSDSGTGLAQKDREVVCSSLDPKNLVFIRDAIKQQKAYSTYLAALCLLGLWLAVRYAARAQMAKILSELPGPRII